MSKATGPLPHKREQTDGKDINGNPIDFDGPFFGKVIDAHEGAFVNFTDANGASKTMVRLKCDDCTPSRIYEVVIMREHETANESDMSNMILAHAKRSRRSPYRCSSCISVQESMSNPEEKQLGIPEIYTPPKPRDFNKETI